MKTLKNFRVVVIPVIAAVLFGTYCSEKNSLTASVGNKAESDDNAGAPFRKSILHAHTDKDPNFVINSTIITPKNLPGKAGNKSLKHKHIRKNYKKLRPESNEYAFAYEPEHVTDKFTTEIVDTDYYYVEETDHPEFVGYNDMSEEQKGIVTTYIVSDAINTDYQEFGPVVSPDGKTMYFSRYKHPDNIGGRKDIEDIWFSTWNEEKKTWNPAQNIGRPLNNKYPNYVNSVSYDGQTLLLGNIYLENGKEKPGLSVTHKTEEGWSFPEPLTIEGVKKQPEMSGAYLSEDGRVLITSFHKKKDNEGSHDLYISFKTKHNTFSEPKNLGKQINSNETETAPFLSKDGKKLYFTSNRKDGYGGCDLYESERLDDSWTSWSTPKNLGPKINNADNQSFFTVTSRGDVYYTSDEGRNGDLNMYSLVLPQYMPKRTQYKVPVTRTVEKSKDLYENEVNLSMVFFDNNKAELKIESQQELYRIANILTESPAAELEIIGYCDNKGSDEENYELAQQRIEAVKNYLIKTHNITGNRFREKNFGESNPLSANDTDDGRAMNRRCDLIIRGKLLVRY
jgi:outer membrane protein OmpA-like peptidoglycan-associated protein